MMDGRREPDDLTILEARATAVPRRREVSGALGALVLGVAVTMVALVVLVALAWLGVWTFSLLSAPRLP